MGLFKNLLRRLITREQKDWAKIYLRSRGKRVPRNQKKRMTGYLRIHAWLESRVGPMAGQDVDNLHWRLLRLVEEEESLWGSYAVGGLESYIQTYSYRKMLDKNADAEQVQQHRSRWRKQDYQRIHSWLESRIGSMKGQDPGELHSRLEQLVEEEERGWWGETPLPGLAAYVKTNAYRKMLEGPEEPAKKDCGKPALELTKSRDSPTPEEPAEQRTCPDCGKMVGPDWRVCQYCMFELGKG